MSRLQDRELVVGVTPCGEPHAAVVVGVARAGGLGVLDLGRDATRARGALVEVCRWWSGGFGVRVPVGCPLSPTELPDQVEVVMCGPGSGWPAMPGRRVWVEVVSVTEARAAVRAGASGVIARGAESGGRVGSASTFVLVQQLVADPQVGVPVWAAGGIGLHTAAAAVAGGAAGVVLDAQLALVSEMDLPERVAAAVRVMDGSETAVVGGYRVYSRPGVDHGEPATIASRLGGRELGGLPVGQDGAFAAGLAARFRTAGGVVSAVRAAVTGQLRAAARGAARGEFPWVVQGPMTRVSDQAGFAAAVAAGGGMPCVALSLMSGEQAQNMLEQTAAVVGERAWGVGILGFAPPEVRQAQLAVVHRVRPPYVVIAGAHPGQAAALEAAGIATVVHVPSPGLLDQFLAAGARRFVFEGRECGGHVGPRASFPLWEQQIAHLLTFDDAHGGAREWEVLFAGGIHDERSAAMVTALAAPLSARDARVGVLMGTAYLFTEEAVGAGAIQPGFQQAALDCQATVLLETAPGHATRCADTPFVRTFAHTRDRLTTAGLPREQMWAELEELNLGRLRIAAKGLRRHGTELVPVTEADQHREGMVMLGEIATLRQTTTTIGQLHTQVTHGAAEFLTERVAELGLADRSEPVPARPLDVAIVGMAGVFPGAADLPAFWATVLAGVDAITEVPRDRWDPSAYPELAHWGGFLPGIPFDALAYGIPPAALASIEPVQLLALEVAARALSDAGYERRIFDRETTSVIFGAEAGTDLANAYNFRSLYPTYHATLPAELDDQLPRLTEDSFPGVLANVIAGRIANRLDLGGANYTVDAACASSLAAIDLACKELRVGTSSMVLAGGADVHNSIHDYLMFASVRALSPTGRCRPFDATADGIALGEGVACVVLKRLTDAERDGDRVYAVINGIGSASDGRSHGLTAPRPEGQRRALERAYQMAGISPADIGLLEAHGTGTVVGDRTELEVLTDVFTDAGARAGSCVLGSVKSQIGHTKCAAGITGLIKTAAAVYTGVYPPTTHLTHPNPAWDPHTSPFTFHTSAAPWTRPGPRIAAVSAFGFGGTNFHTVLSAYTGAPAPSHGLHDWPAELFLFTGPDRPAATAQMTHLGELLSANDSAGRPWRLRDLAHSLCQHQTQAQVGHRVWTAIVAENLDDLATQLTHAHTGTTTDGVFHAPKAVPSGQVAMLFPGQGSQRPGMLTELFTTFPHLQHFLDLGHRWAGAMFPPAAFTTEGTERQRAALTDTRAAQPALGIAGLAMHQLLTSLGIHPDHLAGHSYGELVALAAAGALQPAALLELSHARGRAILQASPDDPGTMAAITASAAQVQAILGEGPVVIANHNAPHQTVISGPTPAVQHALHQLHQAGLDGTPIRVACAFHSPLIAAATPRFASDLEGHPITTPRLPVWSNTTAAPYPPEATAIRATLATHVTAPVLFVEQIEAMYTAGARVFIETGPGRVLTHLVSTILADRPHTALATDIPGHGGLRQLLRTLAELATTGVPLDPTALFHGRDITPVPLHAPPRPSWLINGHRVATADGLSLPHGLRPAHPVPVTVQPHPVTAQPDPGTPSETGRDAAVREFLRTSRELIATQREIMLGYLGASLPATPLPEAPPGAAQPVPARPTAMDPVRGPDPAEQVVLTPESVLTTVRSLISERTGYPAEMLDADLDLEADLSIDSIKRTELIGLLTTRLGLAAGRALDESVVPELSRLRTLRAIVEWIINRTDAVHDAPAQQVRRYLVEATALPPLAEPSGASLAGRQVAILGDGVGIALELSVLLERRGAQVRLLDPDQPGDVSGVDALIHLAALDRGRDVVLPEGFTTLRAAMVGGVDQLLVVTGSGGRFARTPHANGLAGVGLPGLVRTIACEFPDQCARVVDVDPKEEPDQLATQLLSELLSPDAPTAVGYSAGERITLRPVAAPLAATGAPGLALGPESVVLLTGGARGITARVAIGLARASGCHLELVGRTPAPAAHEDSATATAPDRVALRRVLAQAGDHGPAQIEVAISRILAEREIRSTLAELAGLAASVRYTPVDVQIPDAVTALVQEVYQRHGRLDGIVHGAGVLADRLMAEKTLQDFAQVWATKVQGARALAEAARADLGFLVLFGSISGVFGNRGQADYAAANDALDTLARSWSSRSWSAGSWSAGTRGRVLAVDWGPWASPGDSAGMVSAELAREYARRGIGLIQPADGVASLLAELAHGTDPHVVYLAGDPSVFGAGRDG